MGRARRTLPTLVLALWIAGNAGATSVAPPILEIEDARRALALLQRPDAASHVDGLSILASSHVFAEDPGNEIHRSLVQRAVALLQDRDARVREAARTAIPGLASTYRNEKSEAPARLLAGAVPVLIPLIGRCDVEGDSAARALGSLGEPSRPVLNAFVEALAACGSRPAILSALTGIPGREAAIPQLLLLVEGGQPAASAAARALADMPIEAERSRGDIVSAISRAVAAKPDGAWLDVLARLGSDGWPSLDVLVQRASDPAVRATAVERLAAAGESALPSFTAALADPDAGVRNAALRELSRLGARAAPAVAVLAKMPDVGAEITLADIGTPEAKAAIAARNGAGEWRPPIVPLAIGGFAIGAVALLALVARGRG